jgi:hypothetical protein
MFALLTPATLITDLIHQYTDRTLPSRLEVFTHTHARSDEPGGGETQIDTTAGSAKAPGTVERTAKMTKPATPDGGASGVEGRLSLVEDQPFTFENLACDQDVEVMQEPEDVQESECAGLCHQRLEAAQNGNTTVANLVRLLLVGLMT